MMTMIICIYVCSVGEFLQDRCRGAFSIQNLFLLTLKVQLVQDGCLINSRSLVEPVRTDPASGTAACCCVQVSQVYFSGGAFKATGE